VSFAEYTEGTVYLDSGTGNLSYVLGVYDPVNGTAYGYYQNSVNVTGWSVLEIETNAALNSNGSSLMYAAGYLEGVLTAR